MIFYLEINFSKIRPCLFCFLCHTRVHFSHTQEYISLPFYHTDNWKSRLSSLVLILLAALPFLCFCSREIPEGTGVWKPWLPIWFLEGYGSVGNEWAPLPASRSRVCMSTCGAPGTEPKVLSFYGSTLYHEPCSSSQDGVQQLQVQWCSFLAPVGTAETARLEHSL